jgi:hypothetical protein
MGVLLFVGKPGLGSRGNRDETLGGRAVDNSQLVRIPDQYEPASRTTSF